MYARPKFSLGKKRGYLGSSKKGEINSTFVLSSPIFAFYFFVNFQRVVFALK